MGTLAARPRRYANQTHGSCKEAPNVRRRSDSGAVGATKLGGELRTRGEPVQGAQKRQVWELSCLTDSEDLTLRLTSCLGPPQGAQPRKLFPRRVGSHALMGVGETLSSKAIMLTTLTFSFNLKYATFGGRIEWPFSQLSLTARLR